MSYRDPKADRQLADALRVMGAADSTSTREMDQLARRIIRQADPVLKARRGTSTWWEYAASWGRALVPLGLSAATIAVLVMLWLMPPRSSVEIQSGSGGGSNGAHAALLGAVANRVPAHELVDLVVSPAANDSRLTSPKPVAREGDAR